MTAERIAAPAVPAAVEQLAVVARGDDCDEASQNYARACLAWFEDMALHILADIDFHLWRTRGRGL